MNTSGMYSGGERERISKSIDTYERAKEEVDILYNEDSDSSYFIITEIKVSMIMILNQNKEQMKKHKI